MTITYVEREQIKTLELTRTVFLEPVREITGKSTWIEYGLEVIEVDGRLEPSYLPKTARTEIALEVTHFEIS